MSLQQNINKQPIVYRLCLSCPKISASYHLKNYIEFIAVVFVVWVTFGHLHFLPSAATHTHPALSPIWQPFMSVFVYVHCHRIWFIQSQLLCVKSSHIYIWLVIFRAFFFRQKKAQHIKNDLCSFFQSLTRARLLFSKLFLYFNIGIDEKIL